MRCPPGRVGALAGRHDQPRCVLLGCDHHEREGVDLAGCPGAVDVLPQPPYRLLRLAAVAVSIRSAPLEPSLRVLVTSARNCSITSRIPETASRANPLALLGVRRVVVIGAQKAVDDELGDVDVGGVHGREAVEELGADVGVDAVRLV
jgi:hypothetical protein